MPEVFTRIKRPPYVFAIVNTMKLQARRRGEDIIDLGMGNPDRGTPRQGEHGDCHVRFALIENEHRRP